MKDIKKKVNQMAVMGLEVLTKKALYAYEATRNMNTSEAIDALVKEWFTTKAPKGVKKEMIMPIEHRS
jgi:hypothetical protein